MIKNIKEENIINMEILFMKEIIKMEKDIMEVDIATQVNLNILMAI